MSRAVTAPAMLSVYDGQRCIGFLLYAVALVSKRSTATSAASASIRRRAKR